MRGLLPVSPPNCPFASFNGFKAISDLPLSRTSSPYWSVIGPTEIVRNNGYISLNHLDDWASTLMAMQTTERNEQKKRESKGFFSK